MSEDTQLEDRTMVETYSRHEVRFHPDLTGEKRFVRHSDYAALEAVITNLRRDYAELLGHNEKLTFEVVDLSAELAAAGNNPAGHYRVSGPTPGGHPADGMTAIISMGGGAYSTIINPQSFDDGGPEWVMRYGAPESIRYTVAGLLETFDYLLSDNINMKEATERLRIMRAVRRSLAKESGQ